MICNNCGNQIENGKQYCGKCGNYVGNIFNRMNNNYAGNNFNSNYTNNNYYNQKKGISVWTIVMIFIVIQVGVWVVAGVFFSNKSDKYYYTYSSYDDDYSQSDDYPDIDTNNDDYEETPVIDNNAPAGDGMTKVIYDRVYDGAHVFNEYDAKKLIEKDSTSQKNGCPLEIKQVEEEIISKYNITAVNLCEMDTEYARELGNVIRKIYNEFPSARGYFTNMTLFNAGINEINTIAAFMPMFRFATSNASSTYPWTIKTSLLLNSRYFLNPDLLKSSTEISSNNGHFPPNSTIYSPVAHELGHYLSFLAMMRHYNIDSILTVDAKKTSKYYQLLKDFNECNYSLEMITEAYNNYKRDTGVQIELDEWRGTISKYALAKNDEGQYIYDETIAEAFHDIYLNGNSAKDASKYIVNVVRSKFS